jgi:hypothetical protein
MTGADKAEALEIREKLLAGLTQHRIPTVILDFDNELEMARCCEAVWGINPL